MNRRPRRVTKASRVTNPRTSSGSGAKLLLAIPEKAIIPYYQALSSLGRSRIVKAIEQVLHRSGGLAREPIRRRIAAFVGADLRESLVVAQQCLTVRGVGSSDLHFKVFSWLSSLSGRQVRAAALAQEYLMSVRTSAGQAAFMAGEYLGAHSSLHVSVPRLRSAAAGAEHTAGRVAALHGIAHALGRLEAAGARARARQHLIAFIRRRVGSAPSKSEKVMASMIADGWRCNELHP